MIRSVVVLSQQGVENSSFTPVEQISLLKIDQDIYTGLNALFEMFLPLSIVLIHKEKNHDSTSVTFSLKGLCAPEPVKGGECPDFPKQQSLNCAPHSTVDQCKFDADCTESSDHKCCLIGCQKMCLNPSLIEASISGKNFDDKVS